jgi:hypothetical protein
MAVLSSRQTVHSQLAAVLRSQLAAVLENLYSSLQFSQLTAAHRSWLGAPAFGIAGACAASGALELVAGCDSRGRQSRQAQTSIGTCSKIHTIIAVIEHVHMNIST